MSEPKPTGIASASAFARAGLAVYTLLIVYASWYPFSGWHNSGMAPTAYLFAPLPHYWTVFDLATNVIGYLPFGALFVFALYPRVTGTLAIALAVVGGALLSGTMEAVQTYLPSRVPSNLDLLTNISGVLLGALAGVRLSAPFLEQSHLLEMRRSWFSEDAGRGLIVLALWPLAQIYPQSYLFGHGQIAPILSGWLTDLLSIQIDLGAMVRHEAEMSTEHYWLSETIITACGLTGAVLTLLCLTQAKAPRTALALLMIAAAVAVKAMASALLFTPENAYAWITPGAAGGLLIGALMLAGLALAPPIAQRRVAALALILALLAVNAVPANPYFVATLQTWVQGKFLNFNGAAQFLSLLWPFLALWFLYHPAHRKALA